MQSKGFISVKWKEDDPEFTGDLAIAYTYKYYSKSTNYYLVFHSDSHGRMIQEVVYRFKSPICFAALRKQFKLMIGNEIGGKDSDYNNSQEFSYLNSQISIQLRDDVEQVDDKEHHRFSLTVFRDEAVQKMDDEIQKQMNGQ